MKTTAKLRDFAEQEEAAGGWTEPVPVDCTLPPVDPLDPILLPDRLRPWLVDIADRMQCPIEYPAAGAMVALGSLIGRQLGIRPKRYDDWTVVPNLWGGIIGRPGLLKSPAVEEVLRPVHRLEIEAKERFEQEMLEADALQLYQAESVKVIKRRINEALQEGQSDLARSLASEAVRDEVQTPVRKRYLANDATVEKLGELLAANPNGILCFRDELTGFLRSLDQENQQSARKFYLEAWNGTGRFTYDRIGRGTIDIEAACVSILGTIQPGPLQQYLTGALSNGLGDDGLLQRFQFVLWPDPPRGDWRNVDREPDLEARRQAFVAFEGAANVDIEKFQARTDAPVPYIRFSTDAQEAFDRWRGELETELRREDLHPAIESHLAKFRSLVPTLALIVQVAEGASDSVGLVPLQKAITWSELLRMHAARLYSPATNRAAISAAELLRHIKAGDLHDGFTTRQVYLKGWRNLDREGAEDAIEMLEENGWVRAAKVETGGRPKTVWNVNPILRVDL